MNPRGMVSLSLLNLIKLKIFRQKKKFLEELHHKKMNYLYSPEGYNNYGNTNKNSEIPEDPTVILNQTLGTKCPKAKTLFSTNATRQAITKETVQIYRKKFLIRSCPKIRRKVLWQRGMTQNLLKLKQNQKMNEPI